MAEMKRHLDTLEHVTAQRDAAIASLRAIETETFDRKSGLVDLRNQVITIRVIARNSLRDLT